MGEVAIPSNVAELLVVRHGETDWNALARLQGHSESDLNEAGKKQVQAVKFVAQLLKEIQLRCAVGYCSSVSVSIFLFKSFVIALRTYDNDLQVAEKLANLRLEFAAIYSSDLRRAVDTAEAIAEKCQFRSKIIVRENLRERCLGDLEGLTRTEARTAAPEALKVFMKNDDNLSIPGGGESIEQLCVRVQDAFEQIATENLGKRVVVVTHGGVLRTSHIIAKGLPCTGKVVNASINAFRISDEKEWEICSWGDVSHLQDIGFLNTGFGGDKLSG